MAITLILFMFLAGLVYSRLFCWSPHGSMMCGLAGFTGDKPVDPEKLKILLLDNQTRGVHSTGMYGKQLFKSTDAAKEFIKQPAYMLAAKGATTIITHTRHATMGEHSKENAHPFKLKKKNVGTVIGTHNGWLVKELYEEMCEQCNFKEQPAIDSVAIYQHLINNNMDINSLADLEGAIALAYIYKQKLHLYRRDSKPLFIGEADEGIYYSSRTNGLEQIGVKGIHELDEHRLYVFNSSIIENQAAVKKPIVAMKCDQSPSFWDQKVFKSQEEQLEEKFPKWATEKKKKSSTRATIHTGYKHTHKKNGASGGKGQYSTTKSDVVYPSHSNKKAPFLDQTAYKELNLNPLFSHLEKTIIQNANIIKIDSVDGNAVEVDDFNAAFITGSVYSAVSGSALPFWLVKIQGTNIYGITDIEGNVSLKIPKNEIKDDMSILIIDPFNSTNYYATDIKYLKSGKVSEVAFLIPFRDSEEEDGDNRKYLWQSALLRRCFKETFQFSETESSHQVGSDKDVREHKGGNTQSQTSRCRQVYDKYAQRSPKNSEPVFRYSSDLSHIHIIFDGIDELKVPLLTDQTDILFPEIKCDSIGLPQDWSVLDVNQYTYFDLKRIYFEGDMHTMSTIKDHADSVYGPLKKSKASSVNDNFSETIGYKKSFDSYITDVDDDEFSTDFTTDCLKQLITMDKITLKGLQRSYDLGFSELRELQEMLEQVEHNMDTLTNEVDMRLALDNVRSFLSKLNYQKEQQLEQLEEYFPVDVNNVIETR